LSSRSIELILLCEDVEAEDWDGDDLREERQGVRQGFEDGLGFLGISF